MANSKMSLESEPAAGNLLLLGRNHWKETMQVRYVSNNGILCNTVPEQENETISFDDHSYQGVSQQDHDDSAKEADCGFHLVSLEKEPERPLYSYDASKSAEK